MTLGNDANTMENKINSLSPTAQEYFSLSEYIFPTVSPLIMERFSHIILLRASMV